MDELRFDDRVAIVTGAGGNPSLGRAFALLLAERGARVVVNDIGQDPESRGYSGVASAEAVAAEIRDLGGAAVAETSSVATPEGAAAIVRTALDAFGRLDILVNNAGVCSIAPVDVMTDRDIVRHLEVNLLGPLLTSRAAWPSMVSQGYGRIVNIGSRGMNGMGQMVAYDSSKGGVFSLTRALAAEGAPDGIKVNTVGPSAFTRMLASQHYEDSALYRYTAAKHPPELVAPVVVLLAHERCPVSGECIEAAGGRISRTVLAETPGLADPDLTVERLAARWDEVMDDSTLTRMDYGESDTARWRVKPYRAD